MAFDGSDFLFGLLDKDLEKLGIQMFRIGRNDGQRDHFGGLRLRLHPLGFRRDRGLLECLLAGCFDIQRLEFLGCDDRFIRFPERCFEHALLDVPQYGEARLGIVEHVPRFAAPRLHRFHVVLDADYGIGKTVGFFLRQPDRAACTEHGSDQLADAIHDLHGTGFVQHQQAGFDAVDQRRHTVEPG